MALISSVYAVADNHADVPSALDTLFGDNSINSTNLLQLQVVPFGTNQFQITVTYTV